MFPLLNISGDGTVSFDPEDVLYGKQGDMPDMDNFKMKSMQLVSKDFIPWPQTSIIKAEDKDGR